jgi:hypothetical protein
MEDGRGDEEWNAGQWPDETRAAEGKIPMILKIRRDGQPPGYHEEVNFSNYRLARGK